MFQKPELAAVKGDLHWKSIVLSVLKMRVKAKKTRLKKQHGNKKCE